MFSADAARKVCGVAFVSQFVVGFFTRIHTIPLEFHDFASPAGPDVFINYTRLAVMCDKIAAAVSAGPLHCATFPPYNRVAS